MTPGQILAGILLAIVIGFGGAWQVQDWRYEKRLADRDATQALAVAKSVSEAREEEQRRQSATNKAGSDAREEIKVASADAGAADAAGDRLHVEAGKFAAAACSDPGAAQRGASATGAAMVLSELFQRADKRAGELAAAYDRARLAGLACEKSYDGVSLRPE